MTIKDWIQTYARELEGSDAERELEAITKQATQEAYKAGYIAKGIEETNNGDR